MDRKVLIAGQEGMVGSAVYTLLKKKNFKIIDCKRKNLENVPVAVETRIYELRIASDGDNTGEDEVEGGIDTGIPGATAKS